MRCERDTFRWADLNRHSTNMWKENFFHIFDTKHLYPHTDKRQPYGRWSRRGQGSRTGNTDTIGASWHVDHCEPYRRRVYREIEATAPRIGNGLTGRDCSRSSLGEWFFVARCFKPVNDVYSLSFQTKRV